MSVEAKGGEVVVGTVLALGGAVLVALSTGMPKGSVALPGPGFVPAAVGVLLGLAGAGSAVAAWRRPGDGARVSLGGWRVWGSIAILALAAAIFEPVGAPLTLAGAFFVFSLLLGGYGIVRSAVAGIVAAAVSWLVFTKVLGVGLPAGLLPL